MRSRQKWIRPIRQLPESAWSQILLNWLMCHMFKGVIEADRWQQWGQSGTDGRQSACKPSQRATMLGGHLQLSTANQSQTTLFRNTNNLHSFLPQTRNATFLLLAGQFSTELLEVMPCLVTSGVAFYRPDDLLFTMFKVIIWQSSWEQLSAYRTRAQLSLGLADRTHGAHSQPASITVRVWCFEHVVACAWNVNVATCLFT